MALASSSPQSAALPSISDAPRLLVYPLFLASGMAGLIYEVVWTRMLLYVFGAGIYAVTAVLAAFMAGLALGSFLLGRASDRMKHPIRFYAILEFFICLIGFALPPILHRLNVVDGWAYARWGQDFTMLTACRFAVAFAVLLVPTTLMGATLPVLAKAMVRRQTHLGLHIGELYAINTTGAVLGVFLAGFYFIGRFGVVQTEYIAAILNLFAAVGALVVAKIVDNRMLAAGGVELAERASEPVAEEPAMSSAPALAPAQVKMILFASFMTGLVALASQVLWFRSLVFAFEYLKNTTYAFSAMLTIFLLGLAVGSAVIGTVVDRHSNPMRLYGILLVLLGVAIAFSVNTVHAGAEFIITALEAFGLPRPLDPQTQQFNWPLAVTHIMSQSAAVLAIPTLLMGMAFPVAARAIVSTRTIGGQTGWLYALNTMGAIAGSVVACFIIVPLFGLTGGLFLLAGIDALLGVAIIAMAPNSRAYLLALAPVGIALIVGAGLILPSDRAMQHLNTGESLVYYDEGPTATVSVIQNSFGFKTIYVDGVGVAGTDPILQTDQKSLAHVPALMVEDPKTALTVGFGSGGASYSYLLHDRLEKVHCVEICESVPLAAPYLTEANHGVLTFNDPRYDIIYDDARTYLQYTEQKYDIIATDCTDLRYKSNANLYDVEYFEFCREALNPGGIVVVWMPLGGLSLDMFKIALRTFHRVFPEMAVFYMNNEPTHYILLLGWRDEMTINYQRIADRLREPDVRADLAELDLDDPVKLLSTFITAGDNLEQYLAGEVLNTEDYPIIEFESPKYGYFDRPLLDNLASLVEVQVSPSAWIEAPGLPEADRERLARYESAMPLIIEGHEQYRSLDIEGSAKSYIAALEKTPEDKSLETLLRYREIEAAAAQESPWGWLMLGRVSQLRGRDQEAIARFDRVERILAPMNPAPETMNERWLRTARAWREEVKSNAGAEGMEASKAEGT